MSKMNADKHNLSSHIVANGVEAIVDPRVQSSGVENTGENTGENTPGGTIQSDAEIEAEGHNNINTGKDAPWEKTEMKKSNVTETEESNVVNNADANGLSDNINASPNTITNIPIADAKKITADAGEGRGNNVGDNVDNIRGSDNIRGTNGMNISNAASSERYHPCHHSHPETLSHPRSQCHVVYRPETLRHPRRQRWQRHLSAASAKEVLDLDPRASRYSCIHTSG
jgi:hypothetical protein